MITRPAPSIEMSTAPADIAVFSKDRRPILIVEVKDGTLYSTAESAVGLRRNLMRHQLLPDAPFFMLATRVQVFLWRGDAHPAAYPHYSATADSILESYGSGRAIGDKPVYRGALEIVLFFWLSELASGVCALSPDSEVDRMLVESGLYDQIRGGTADFDVQL